MPMCYAHTANFSPSGRGCGNIKSKQEMKWLFRQGLLQIHFRRAHGNGDACLWLDNDDSIRFN